MKINKSIFYLGFCLILVIGCTSLIRYLFQHQKKDEICFKNLKRLGEAFSNYALDHEGSLPIIKDPMQKTKVPITWVTHLWPYVKDEEIFCCPAAAKEELSYSSLSLGRTVPCSYGMFFDSGRTYGIPVPLLADSTQKNIKGVYSIGNEGFEISKDSKGKFYTQLSFYQTLTGTFDPLGQARHGHNIHVLKADGSVSNHGVDIVYIKK